MRNIVAALVALALTGCASVLCDVEAKKSDYVRLPDSQGRIATFRYLGAGGWLIRRGDDVVMTAPFFSNPALWKPFARRNEKAIDEQLQHIAADLPDIDAVVAAHAHYDHLMDLPYILPKLPRRVPMIGGKTVCNTLHKLLKKESRDCRRELPDGDIRIRAFDSQHAPHWRFGVKLQLPWPYNEPLERVPTRAFFFREGEPLSYVIDFMENGTEKVALRVYYTDAGANPGFGIPDVKGIHVAILTVASFSYVKEQPKTIFEELGKPKHLLLGHWENFFWPARNDGCRVPFTNVKKYLEDLKGESLTLPDRRALITIEY